MGTTTTNSLSAVLHDGTRIPVTIAGNGPYLLLPLRTAPYDDATAATMRAWGGDPDLGPTLVNGPDRPVHGDRRGLRGASAQPPGAGDIDRIERCRRPAGDRRRRSRRAIRLLRILVAGAGRTAARCPHRSAGGSGNGRFPTHRTAPTPRCWPSPAPRTTRHRRRPTARARRQPDAAPGDWDAAGIQADPDQTAQFVTLYEDLQAFDDVAVAGRLTVPRLCFVGELDNIDYGPKWGDTRVVIADAVRDHHDELTAAGLDDQDPARAGSPRRNARRYRPAAAARVVDGRSSRPDRGVGLMPILPKVRDPRLITVRRGGTLTDDTPPADRRMGTGLRRTRAAPLRAGAPGRQPAT